MQSKKERDAEYYRKNREKILERVKKYTEKHSESAKKTQARWRFNNPERMKEHRRKWQDANGNNSEYKARRLMQQRSRYKLPENNMKERTRAKEYRDKNPEKTRAMKRDLHFRKKYGITTMERNRLFEMQGKRCRICQSESSIGRGFHVDHCHVTNTFRGILCHHCNLMLGHSRDNIAILEAAITYLKGEFPCHLTS